MMILIYGLVFMSITGAFSNQVYEECGINKDVFQGCSEDCTAQVFCVGNHLIELNCRLQSDGEKPYCNLTSNICQSQEVPCNNNNPSTPNPTTPSPPNPNEFQCLGRDEFYPDPLDCSKYYQCKNKVPTSGFCYAGQKFHPKKAICDKLTKCVLFSPEKGECRNKIGKYVVHPLDKNVYVRCEAYPIVMRCPVDHIFDVKAQECRYDCVKRGTFPDNDDEEYFYVCEKVGLYWQPKYVKCSDGMIYDTTFVGCILKDSEESSGEEPPGSDAPTETPIPIQ